MRIHREGRRLLIILIIIMVALNLGIRWNFSGNEVLSVSVFISLILFLLVLQFFRNPSIITIENKNYIIAPADGKVVVIEETVEEEFFNSPRKQVSIFMSPINVHINRNPISGKIEYFKYHPGKYLVAWHPKSSGENERTTFVVRREDGLEILVRQIAGAVARRIRWYINPGDRVKQGEEFGFIKFGSRVDVFLPLNSVIKVGIGDKTKAGITVIAEVN